MALLLLSGGTDSACLAYVLRPALCLTVDYGQKIAKAEIDSSRNICRQLKLRHETVRIDLRRFAAGTMSGKEQKYFGAAPEWWPYRNQMLITVGAMVAFKNEMNEIIIGTVKTDRRHKDGGIRFVRQIDRLIRHQEGGIRLHAPASKFSAEELASRTKAPLDLLGLTFSCHRSNFPCGQCGGCRKNEAVVSFAIEEKLKRTQFGRMPRSRLKPVPEL
jgi:7-cyano-7-deazaguanine synthase